MKRAYKCTVCNHVDYFEGEMPETWVCEVCGADASMFVEITEEESN